MRSNQFTIRRLLANITVVAIVLALVTAFPIAARNVTLEFLLYSPAIVIFAFAMWRSSRRIRTTTLFAVLIFIAILLTPRIFVSWASPPTFWDIFMLDFKTLGLSTGFAAFVAACIDAVW